MLLFPPSISNTAVEEITFIVSAKYIKPLNYALKYKCYDSLEVYPFHHFFEEAHITFTYRCMHLPFLIK